MLTGNLKKLLLELQKGPTEITSGFKTAKHKHLLKLRELGYLEDLHPNSTFFRAKLSKKGLEYKG